MGRATHLHVYSDNVSLALEGPRLATAGNRSGKGGLIILVSLAIAINFSKLLIAFLPVKLGEMCKNGVGVDDVVGDECLEIRIRANGARGRPGIGGTRSADKNRGGVNFGLRRVGRGVFGEGFNRSDKLFA